MYCRKIDLRGSAHYQRGHSQGHEQGQDHDRHHEKDAEAEKNPYMYRSRGYVRRTSESRDVHSDDKEDWESGRTAEGRRYRSRERDSSRGDRDRDWKPDRDLDRGYYDGRSSRQSGAERSDRDRDRHRDRDQGRYDSRARCGREGDGRRRGSDARFEGSDSRKEIHRLSRQSNWGSEPRYGRDGERLSRVDLEPREDRGGLEWSGDPRRGSLGRGSAGSYSGNSQPPSPLRGSGRPAHSSNGSGGAFQPFTFRQGRIFNCGYGRCPLLTVAVSSVHCHNAWHGKRGAIVD